jgi:hypothetical protein
VSDPDDMTSRFVDIPDPLEKAGAGRVRPASRAAPALPLAADRAQTLQRRWLAVALSVGWLGVHLAVYGIRRDFPALPAPYVIAEIVAPLILALTSLVIAMSPGKLGLGLGMGAVVGLAVAGPFSFWVLAVGAPEPRPAEPDPSFWLNAVVCLDITLAWISVPLLFAALTLRSAFPAGSRGRSALVGAACGLFSGGIMNLHCPNVDRLHLLIGHGIPVLVAAAVGASLLSRWARA